MSGRKGNESWRERDEGRGGRGKEGEGRGEYRMGDRRIERESKGGGRESLPLTLPESAIHS